MTTVALLGTLAALALTALLGWGFFAASRFTGAVSEEAPTSASLPMSSMCAGCLLGGVVIGGAGRAR